MRDNARPRFDRYAVLLSMLVGCIDPSGPLVPTSVVVVTGVPGRSTPGEQFDTVRVKLTSQHGDAVSGWRVIWNAPGELVVIDSLSDATGLARAVWTLPRFPSRVIQAIPMGPSGKYRLTAEAIGAGQVTMTTKAHAFTATQVDASSQLACGTDAGRLWCWGAIYHLFPGHENRLRVPVEIPLPVGVAALSVTVNESLACVRDAARMPWCAAVEWGGEFRRVADAPPLLEVDLEGSPNPHPLTLACGRSAIDQTPWCWRKTATGMTAATQRTPEPYTAFALGREFACGLSQTDGAAHCWGSNQYGQLGDGTDQDSDQPIAVAGEHHFVTLDASGLGACGGTAQGAIYCWGSGPPDPLSRTPELVTVAGITGPDFTLGATGEGYIVHGGELHIWYANQPMPLFESAAHLVIASISSDFQACVITTSTEVYCSENILTGNGDTSNLPSNLTAVSDPRGP